MTGAPLTVLTVALHDELAFARVLAADVRVIDPVARMVVVSADGLAPAGFPDGVEGIGVAELAGAGVTEEIARLSPPLFVIRATAHALLRELTDGATVVLLAPQTRLLGSIDWLLGTAEAPLSFAARAIPAVPDDGLRPDATDLADVPAVDGGVAVLRGGARARAVVSGWIEDSERLEVAHARDTDAGRDALAAAAMEEHGVAVAVLNRPDATLAWWSIGAERLTAGPDGPRLRGTPVGMVRLPGFDPTLPTRLHPTCTRVRVSTDHLLHELLDGTARAVLAAGGRTTTPTSLALPDGSPAPLVMRQLIADELAAGRLTEPPRDTRGWEACFALLNEPAGWGAELGMTRYLDALWRSRDDLQRVYPEVRGSDGAGYAGWVWVYGRDLVPDELLPPRPPHVPPAAGVDAGHAGEEDVEAVDPLWGVNVAGFFEAELGLGEAARLVIAGLDSARVPALPVQGSLVPPCRQGTEFTFATPEEAPYPISILCLNGDVIPRFAAEAGSEFFDGRHTIAFWWWEVGDLPAEWHDSFRWIDEVWVATDHIKQLIEPACPVPVTKVTLPVTAPAASGATRAEFGLGDDEFLFLYVYDYHSTEARKNPTGLVRAFKQAFSEGSGARLVLKCINADRMLAHHERVLLEVGDRQDITFVDRYLSVGDKNALIALCDCYVSPHRSEGFGLTPAEAMLLGTPVIATNYGGVLDFLDEENAYLVDYELRPVGPHADPYPPDAQWADPDERELAARMRHVFEHRREAAARTARGAHAIRESHGPEAAGRSMRELLQARYEDLVAAGAHGIRVRRTAPLNLSAPSAEVRSALRTTGARGGGVRGRADHVRQRVARSLTARRDLVDAQLIDELARLDERVRALTAELDRHRMAAHAEVLAQFRRATAEGDRRHRELTSRADRLSRLVEHHLAEHDVLPFMAEEHAPALLDDPVCGRVLGYKGAAGDLEPYRAFTDVFRGSEDRVRALQEPYLPLLRDAAPVLDTGCGRGEMLDLLRAAGIEARGVDADPGMVEHARRKGHDVILGDAGDHLEGLPEGSVGAVVSLEVVEHLPAEVLERFLRLAKSRLRPGGLLIAETVNPHALFALKGFWLDPTHHHPLFPEVLLTLARIAGFPSAYVFHPTGTGDVERDRTRQPTYALVARA